MLDLLLTPARQAATANDTIHRPWPLPERPWTMAQTLEAQLFAHWRAPVEALAQLLPGSLEPDLHDGEAWVTLTIFRAVATRLRGTLPVPRLSTFLQANVRTYVRFEDRPGVFFLALHTPSAVAAEAGRLVYGVPLERARIYTEERAGVLDVSVSADSGVFAARARPVEEVAHPAPGSLDRFLLERFCFYLEKHGRLLRGDVHHPPWPVRQASVEVDLNTLLPAGVDDPEMPALAHTSERQDVLLWPLVPAYEEARASSSASRR